MQVSEPFRYTMRYAGGMLPTECLRCGAALRRAGGGRPPSYCSSACRVAAHRARPVLPVELRQRDRWVRHTARKVPVRADTGKPASSTNPTTWASHSAAQRSTRGVGSGFVLNGDGIICLDLDHCLDSGQLTGWARDILDACPDTFVEISASGTGLHIWGYGSVPVGQRIRDGRNVEVYGNGRYIATTGRRFRQAPLTLADLGSTLASL